MYILQRKLTFIIFLICHNTKNSIWTTCVTYEDKKLYKKCIEAVKLSQWYLKAYQ